MFPFNVITHDAVPLHAPDHPTNVEPAAGVAVSVTRVPERKLALQVGPQLIPAGLLLMVPAPFPLAWTLSWTEITGGASALLIPPPQLQVTQTAVRLHATAKSLCQDIFAAKTPLRWSEKGTGCIAKDARRGAMIFLAAPRLSTGNAGSNYMNCGIARVRGRI